jgi:hypothetical protein
VIGLTAVTRSSGVSNALSTWSTVTPISIHSVWPVTS